MIGNFDIDYLRSEAMEDDHRSRLHPVAFSYGQTDAANAERYVDMFQAEVLHVPPWRKWLSWDGTRWREDNDVGVRQRAKRYSRSLWRQISKIAEHATKEQLASAVSFIRQSNQTAKIAAYLSLAEVDERVVCNVIELNADPTLLNCVNGTVDLVTGKLRPHNPADRITQICNVAYDPSAECPKWLETLDLIFDGDQRLIAYVQRLLGYSLSGDTGEHLLPIAFGKGNNGKSTVWNTITDLLGDYASLANDELLLGDKSNHPTEKASLYQKRFVAISEPEKNSKLKESRVKELTGDRQITARRMHEDFWSFQRTHTFWLSTNHLPRIDGTDDGIWRRVKLIPFTVNLKDKVKPIPDFDKWLVKHEGRGILAWLVRGYLDYRQHGFDEPESVTEATKSYRSDSDELGEFLNEYCVLDPNAKVAGSELYRVYCEQAGKIRMSKNVFGQAMTERFTKRKSHGKIIYEGVGLLQSSDPTTQSENSEKHDENDIGGDVGTPKPLDPDFPTRMQDQCPRYPHVSPDTEIDDQGVLF